MKRRVGIVGGGASGMTAAIFAARAGADVTIYERNERVGKKILATGNGKCNFSNEAMGKEAYNGSGAAIVEAALAQFGVASTKAFFEQIGLRIKDRNGYLYPASEQAAAVLDVLRYEVGRLGVRVHTGCQIIRIEKRKQEIILEAADGEESKLDSVVLSCGGKAAPKTGSDGAGLLLAAGLGHRIVETVPALTALRCEGDFWKSVAGVRCDAKVTLFTDGKLCREECGEVQMTDYGISGIPVFQLSRAAAYALKEQKEAVAEIDFLPDLEAEQEELFWKARWDRQGWQTMEQFLTGIVNKKIGLLLLKIAGIGATGEASRVPEKKRNELKKLFRRFTVRVKRVNSYEQAQVCAGGVDCAELTGQLESKKAAGVYFAGEIVDIDGRCGGYNLQWAWTSGAIAGTAAAGGSSCEKLLCIKSNPRRRQLGIKFD